MLIFLRFFYLYYLTFTPLDDTTSLDYVKRESAVKKLQPHTTVKTRVYLKSFINYYCYKRYSSKTVYD